MYVLLVNPKAIVLIYNVYVLWAPRAPWSTKRTRRANPAIPTLCTQESLTGVRVKFLLFTIHCLILICNHIQITAIVIIIAIFKSIFLENIVQNNYTGKLSLSNILQEKCPCSAFFWSLFSHILVRNFPHTSLSKNKKFTED